MTRPLRIVLALLVVISDLGCSSGQRAFAPRCATDEWRVTDFEECFIEAFRSLSATKQTVANVGFVVVLPRTSMRVAKPYVIASENAVKVLVIDKDRLGDERGIEILIRSDAALRYFTKFAGCRNAPIDPIRGHVSYYVMLFDTNKTLISVGCVSTNEFAGTPDMDRAIDNNGEFLSASQSKLPGRSASSGLDAPADQR